MYYKLGNYDQALLYYGKAREILEGMVLEGIGDVYKYPGLQCHNNRGSPPFPPCWCGYFFVHSEHLQNKIFLLSGISHGKATRDPGK
jgi:hypothetical protein